MKPLLRILQLLKSKNISDTQFVLDMDFARSTVSDWKAGRNKSYVKHIERIADYLNVSVDYLLGRTDDPQSYTTVKRDGEELFSNITDDERVALKAFLKTYREQKKKK